MPLPQDYLIQPLLFAGEKTEDIETDNRTVAEPSHLLTPVSVLFYCLAAVVVHSL